MNIVEKNTLNPRDTLITAAIAIGSVLNGLKAIPSIGKNKGADWNSTAIVVKSPPIAIDLPILIFPKFKYPAVQFQK